MVLKDGFLAGSVKGKEGQGETGCSMEQSFSPALRCFFWCE